MITTSYVNLESDKFRSLAIKIQPREIRCCLTWVVCDVCRRDKWDETLNISDTRVLGNLKFFRAGLIHAVGNYIAIVGVWKDEGFDEVFAEFFGK